MEKNNNQFNYKVIDACKGFFYVIVINILASFCFYILAKIIRIFPFSDVVYSNIISYLQICIIPIMFLAFIWIYHKKNRIKITTALELNSKINPIFIMLVMLLLAVTIVTTFPLVNMLYDVLSSAGMNVNVELGFELNTPLRLILGIIPYCILPAVAEETIFRGMIQKGLIRKSKPIVAITIASLSFFIMHGSIAQSFYQIILGFMLGFVGYYGGNIVYPIIFHFLNNLAVILLTYFNVGGFLAGFSLNFVGFLSAIGIFIIGVGLIVGLIFLMKKISKKEPTQGDEYIFSGENIIVEDNSAKLDFKSTLINMSADEKFYFRSAWIVALIIWLINLL